VRDASNSELDTLQAAARVANAVDATDTGGEAREGTLVTPPVPTE